ncbi:unnamed protein product [Hanseniaspora opuntiae]
MADDKDSNTADILSDKKKAISNWWDQTTDLYSRLMNSEDFDRENIQKHIQKIAIDKKDEIFNDINGLSNEVISNVFEQVFGMPIHNPEKLDSVLPVIVGPLSSPSELQYIKCLEKNGTIAWDTKGQFNCLFPQKYLAERNLQDLHLSKEQVENDKDHKKYGKFFYDYSKYLTWKFDNKQKEAKEGEYGKVQKEQVIEKKFNTPEGLKMKVERIKYPTDGSSPITEVEEKLISDK